MDPPVAAFKPTKESIGSIKETAKIVKIIEIIKDNIICTKNDFRTPSKSLLP